MPCEFFEKTGPNPSPEKISITLLDTILAIQDREVDKLKTSIQSLFLQYKGNVPDEEGVKVFSAHHANTLFEIDELILGDKEIRERVSSAMKNPALVGYENDVFEKPFRNGLIYAIYWYGITGIEPDLDTCYWLDDLHSEMINKAIQEIAEALPDVPADVPPPPSRTKRGDEFVTTFFATMRLILIPSLIVILLIALTQCAT